MLCFLHCNTATRDKLRTPTHIENSEDAMTPVGKWMPQISDLCNKAFKTNMTLIIWFHATKKQL